MKKFIRILVIVLVLLLIATPMFGYADSIDLPLYDKDAEKNDFADYFGWDTELMEKKEWDVSYSKSSLGRDYLKSHEVYVDTYIDASTNKVPFTIKRSSIYGKDYYADMVLNTKTYLGISESSGMGGFGIAAIARAEAEKCANGEAGTFESPPYSNNVKYNTWYYGGAVSGSAYPWCCAFVMWCAEQCGYIDSGLFIKTAGCSPLYRYFKNVKGFECYPARNLTTFGGNGYTPVPGDICLFWQGEYAYGEKLMTHIGIVVEEEPDVLHVVEGNTTGFGKVPGGGVCENLYTTAMCKGGNWICNATIVHVEYPASGGAIGVYNFLIDELGLNDAAALGVLISLDNESGINADKLERPYMQGFGLAQWTDSDYYHFYLWENLRKFCLNNNFTWTSYEGQLWFLKHELTESPPSDRYTKCYNYLLGVPNTLDGANSAAYYWAVYHQGGGTFLSPTQYASLMQSRIMSYGAWPDVAGWASTYSTKSDHQLVEEGLWHGTLFDGTEQWDGQIRSWKWEPFGKGPLTAPATAYW